MVLRANSLVVENLFSTFLFFLPSFFQIPLEYLSSLDAEGEGGGAALP
jgi:hypothetical protein